jgi:hypothetical protein
MRKEAKIHGEEDVSVALLAPLELPAAQCFLFLPET